MAVLPRVRQTPQNIQCSYNLDRRVHAVKAYPILSPQGASIFIYGHENGVAIVWRGGRRLKQATPKKDSVMVIDSDSDDDAAASTSAPASSAAFVDKPVFEDAPADTIEGGFPEIVQTLDLALGTAVLNVAVLPLAPSAAKDAEPSFLQEQMAFAITCATADVYVMTLPLTPPSHESKGRPQLRTSLLAGSAGRGAFGEVLLPLGGQSKRCEGVAITLAKQKPAPTAAGASGTSASSSRTGAAAPPTRLIVAAHSREASGTLRLWDVTVGGKRAGNSASFSSLDRPTEPFQTEYLPSPLAGLSFNPTHPTQLLAVDPQRAVRIYDYTLPAIPADDMSDGPFPPQGSWLLSLYPPFARSSTVTAPRKPIVAAAWIAHGHAILALLADGQWGVWDIDRASSSSSTGSSSGGGVFGGRTASSGVRGAALAAFSISGQIEGTTPLRNPVTGSRKSADGDFVPMTPHTRRDVLAATFGGVSVDRLVALRGGVEVVEQRPLSGSTTRGSESAVLWLGGADYIVAVVPDVARFWDAQLRRRSSGGGSLFSGGARPTRMSRLLDLSASLLGERCCGVSVVSRLSQQKPRPIDKEDDENEDEDSPLSSDKGLAPIEVLIQGESRLVVVREESTGSDAFSGDLTSRLRAASSVRKRKAAGGGGGGDTVTSAIVVEPRIRKPGTVTFDLLQAQQALGSQGSLRAAPAAAAASTPQRHRRPPLTKSLFESPARQPAPAFAALTPNRSQSQRSLFDENEVTLTQSMMRPSSSQQRQQQQHAAADPNLAFAGDLEGAADADDDEEAAEDRNVEEEMLDIMEIDRELEAMEEQRRDTGAQQNVFFEGEDIPLPTTERPDDAEAEERGQPEQGGRGGGGEQGHNNQGSDGRNTKGCGHSNEGNGGRSGGGGGGGSHGSGHGSGYGSGGGRCGNEGHNNEGHDAEDDDDNDDHLEEGEIDEENDSDEDDNNTLWYVENLYEEEDEDEDDDEDDEEMQEEDYEDEAADNERMDRMERELRQMRESSLRQMDRQQEVLRAARQVTRRIVGLPRSGSVTRARRRLEYPSDTVQPMPRGPPPVRQPWMRRRHRADAAASSPRRDLLRRAVQGSMREHGVQYPPPREKNGHYMSDVPEGPPPPYESGDYIFGVLKDPREVVLTVEQAEAEEGEQPKVEFVENVEEVEAMPILKRQPSRRQQVEQEEEEQPEVQFVENVEKMEAEGLMPVLERRPSRRQHDESGGEYVPGALEGPPPPAPDERALHVWPDERRATAASTRGVDYGKQYMSGALGGSAPAVLGPQEECIEDVEEIDAEQLMPLLERQPSRWRREEQEEGITTRQEERSERYQEQHEGILH